jgi:hypothetical protein
MVFPWKKKLHGHSRAKVVLRVTHQKCRGTDELREAGSWLIERQLVSILDLVKVEKGYPLSALPRDQDGSGTPSLGLGLCGARGL